METAIIGLDCATTFKRPGGSMARFRPPGAFLDFAATGGPDLVETILRYSRPFQRVLLALDAPLGWPLALGEGLFNHRAGEFLPGDANDLFRRRTDRFVREKTGKLPLDVGADRIARTAHAALNLLSNLRRLSGQAIPLAWDPDLGPGFSAIEVYPAATLKKHGLPAQGYKDDHKPECLATRKRILDGLGNRLDGLPDKPLLLSNADVLDSAACILAGLDFLNGNVLFPEDPDLAAREGWIWF